jgi:hypothetical protein
MGITITMGMMGIKLAKSSASIAMMGSVASTRGREQVYKQMRFYQGEGLNQLPLTPFSSKNRKQHRARIASYQVKQLLYPIDGILALFNYSSLNSSAWNSSTRSISILKLKG